MYNYHLEMVLPPEWPRRWALLLPFGQSRKSVELQEWLKSDNTASFS